MSSGASTITTIPPPSGKVLTLLTSLSNPTNHDRHAKALELRDRALSSSPSSYGDLCLNLARVLAAPSPDVIPESEMSIWNDGDGGVSLMQLRHDPVGGWSQLREMAGLLLKNALVRPPLITVHAHTGEVLSPDDTHYKLTNSRQTRMFLLPDASLEIKSVLYLAVCDADVRVRRVASSIIASTTVGGNKTSGHVTGKCDDGSRSHEALPLREWRDLCPFLVHCLETSTLLTSTSTPQPLDPTNDSSARAVLGSLQTLIKVLEDAPEQFENEAETNAFNRLIPALLKVISLATSVGGESNIRAKRDSLSCIIAMIESMPPALVVVMSDFLGILSSLGNDSIPEVRKLVCRAIVQLLESRTEFLQDHFEGIATFILHASSDTDPDVSLEACEFWLTYGSLDDSIINTKMNQTVEQALPKLIPTLIKNMVYTKDKISELMEQNVIDQQLAEDQAKDLKPVFHKSKTKGGARKEDAQSTNNDNGDESDYESDSEDDNDDTKEWTTRQCSAASLDTLSSVFPNQSVIPHLLPALQESLGHADPWIREAGILALGAVSEGCSHAINECMDQLHPYLMNQVTATDSIPQLKIITCWTLARYIDWVVDREQSGNPQGAGLLGRVVEAILQRSLDRNKRIQIAACSAVSVIAERTGDLLVPYLEGIYRTFAAAMGIYQTRALMILLDTMATMADFIGPASGEGILPGIYVPPILAIWASRMKQNPFDRVTLPLMESLASIVLNLQMNFQPWALQSFDNAMYIVNSSLMTLNDDNDEEDFDPMVCAVDLLDSLVEGLGENFPMLLSSSATYGETFLNVLHSLTGNEVSSVRTSAFALMGDLANKCPTVIQDATGELMTEAITCIDPSYPSVCNNAVWAIGEICVRCEGNAQPLKQFAPDIVQNLISLLMSSGSYQDEYGLPVAGLAENAASTMGRLAKVDPSFVASDLPRFLTGWCDGMTKINDLQERNDAFQGFIMSVQANPESIKVASPNLQDTITSILFAVVSWHIPPGYMPPDLLRGKYQFKPFPSSHPELAQGLGMLLHHLRHISGDEIWKQVENAMPKNVRRLMRESYNL